MTGRGDITILGGGWSCCATINQSASATHGWRHNTHAFLDATYPAWAPGDAMTGDVIIMHASYLHIGFFGYSLEWFIQLDVACMGAYITSYHHIDGAITNSQFI